MDIEIVVVFMLVASVVLSAAGGRDLREAGVPQFHGWDALGYAVFLASLVLIFVVLISIGIK
jgi:hypothetical protein